MVSVKDVKAGFVENVCSSTYRKGSLKYGVCEYEMGSLYDKSHKGRTEDHARVFFIEEYCSRFSCSLNFYEKCKQEITKVYDTGIDEKRTRARYIKVGCDYRDPTRQTICERNVGSVYDKHHAYAHAFGHDKEEYDTFIRNMVQASYVSLVDVISFSLETYISLARQQGLLRGSHE